MFVIKSLITVINIKEADCLSLARYKWMEWNERRMTNMFHRFRHPSIIFSWPNQKTHTHIHTHTFIPAVKICLFTIRPGRDLNRPSWPGPTWLGAELTRIHSRPPVPKRPWIEDICLSINVHLNLQFFKKIFRRLTYYLSGWYLL